MKKTYLLFLLGTFVFSSQAFTESTHGHPNDCSKQAIEECYSSCKRAKKETCDEGCIIREIICKNKRDDNKSPVSN